MPTRVRVPASVGLGLCRRGRNAGSVGSQTIEPSSRHSRPLGLVRTTADLGAHELPIRIRACFIPRIVGYRLERGRNRSPARTGRRIACRTVRTPVRSQPPLEGAAGIILRAISDTRSGHPSRSNAIRSRVATTALRSRRLNRVGYLDRVPIRSSNRLRVRSESRLGAPTEEIDRRARSSHR